MSKIFVHYYVNTQNTVIYSEWFHYLVLELMGFVAFAGFAPHDLAQDGQRDREAGLSGHAGQALHGRRDGHLAPRQCVYIHIM